MTPLPPAATLPRALALAVALAVTALAAPRATAETFDDGRFLVHYTALSTLQLTPAVADAYSIARSPNRALLNVAVQRKAAGRTLGTPVAAQVVVAAVNTIGQLKPLAMRRVDEPPAIYYLGEVTVADQETVTFELQVTPEGERAPIRLRLQQQFFTR